MKDNKYIHQTFNSILIAAVAVITSVVSINLQAQVLEEIVVTAQRRVQSLQEVPISINVYSGDEIDLQGYKNLDDLARFSASVNIAEGVSGQNTTIRGFGTAGSSLTLMSATPLFVDGIHFGSNAMVKNAFMDTERVEVLNGPQPLHFGMNASAGAFNISSKRPTDTFEGDISAEYGNDGKRELNGAFGGPITDTLGFRVAGSYEALDGVLKNRLDHSKFPTFDSLGGRATLEWTPNEKWNVLTKFEINRQRNGGEVGSGCIAEGNVRGYSDSTIDPGIEDPTANITKDANVFIPFSAGGITDGDRVGQGGLVQFDPKYRDADCFNDDYGISRNGPWAKPTITSIVRAGQDSIYVDGDDTLAFDGFIDVAGVQDAFHSQVAGPEVPGEQGTDGYGNRGIDAIDAYNGLLDINYVFDNGINVNSQTGYVRFFRDANSDSGNQPFADSNQHRRIDMYQHSQQIRVESPAEGYDLDVDMDGGVNLNFMFGGFYQEHDKDLFSSNIRGNLRRGQRYNDIWEDANWKSAFWGVDLKFMDQQLTLSVGGRYADIHKEVFMQGYGASHIFDVRPCDSQGDPLNPDSYNPATCDFDNNFKRVDPTLTVRTFIDPITGNGDFKSRPDRGVRTDSPRIFLPGANMAELWTTKLWNRRYEVPLNYRGAAVPSVGLTAPNYANRNGPWGPCDTCIDRVLQDASNYNSQFVLSFTPNGFGLEGNHTFFGKYVSAFKGPVTDTGTSTLPGDLDSIQFTPEYSKSWEFGSRGSLYDGRVRYDITGYRTKFTDLQTDAAVASFDPADIIEQQGVSLNAGNQTVHGAEFNFTAAVTDNLTMTLAGSIMDATFGDFDGGGCNDSEIIAKSILVLETLSSQPNNPNVIFAEGIRDAMGDAWDTLPSASEIPQELLRNGGCRLIQTRAFQNNESSVGDDLTINRSGARPAFAPPYKVVLGGTYTLPVMENYEVFLNAQGYIEGAKVLIPGDLDNSRMYNAGHWDMNISGGIGPQDGSWQLIGFVRNLMEDRLEFNQEYDLTRSGIVFSEDRALSKASFQTYGLRFSYNFR